MSHTKPPTSHDNGLGTRLNSRQFGFENNSVGGGGSLFRPILNASPELNQNTMTQKALMQTTNTSVFNRTNGIETRHPSDEM